MSERTAELNGRMLEVQEVLGGLQQLDRDLRQSIASNLGKIDGQVFAGMSAQASLIATMMQTLGVRAEMLQKALAEPDQQGQVEGAAVAAPPADLAQHRNKRPRPRPVPKDEADGDAQ
jgi:hypothetical protein